MQLTCDAEARLDPAAVQQLIADNQRLRELNAQQLLTIREPQKRIEELERASKRQAAPFSKVPPKKFLAGTIDAEQLAAAHEQRVAELHELTKRPRAEPRNETLAKHLHHPGEQFLEYLNDPTVPATNHRAEQALKTPIVNRKVWGGNRTEAGAEAQSVVSSVLQTCGKKAIDVFAHVSAALGNRWP